VFASIIPQKHFLEKIGGDLVDVSIMVMPGASPATYEPTPRQMARLAKAKAYFSIGVPFENSWLERIASASSEMVIIPTGKGIQKIPMAVHAHDESEGKSDGHGDGILDPHIWLSPERVRLIAANICAGLIQLDTVNTVVYEANLVAFLEDLDRLDEDIRASLAKVPDGQRSFMVFHPSWGYFAEQYGLLQIPIETEGQSPSPRELVEVVERGRELGISVVFVQPQFSDKSAKVIASEIGAQVVPLDPLAEDWADNLRSAAEAFRQELR